MIDISGKKFGRLTAIKKVHARRTSGGQFKTRWLCICDCGAKLEVDSQSLRKGNTASCGCLAKESRAKTPLTHGMTNSKEYRAWSHAKGRCFDPGDPRYPIYGGRGITMCDRWKYSFSSFIADMGIAPMGSTLDRENTNGDYEPGNCRWATRLTQANNCRTNIVVSWNGLDVTLADLARTTGVNYKSLWHFYRKSGDPEIAVSCATKL